MVSLSFNSTLSPLTETHNSPFSARNYEVRLNPRFLNHTAKSAVLANDYAVNGVFERGSNRYSDAFRERKFNSEVEVVSWRERRIKAEISVNSDVESVWNPLTDYERLADSVPNLVYSGRIPCPYPGRIWLEQRGLQRALYWHIEARVALDLQEFPNSPNDRELHFSMVDGDFKNFEGKWSVK